VRFARKAHAPFEVCPVDETDRRILALFQHDTRQIAERLGARVGLSAAAVQRRLKRMRESGEIEREVAQLSPVAAGLPVLCIVELTMVSRPAPHAQLERFKREMAARPEVQQCYQVTGSSDFVLVVAAASMEAYGAFARQWFETNPNVARFATQVVLDRVKTGCALPL
jgi:Lrp/AsnC family leucine-responsive transcriptional regulator